MHNNNRKIILLTPFLFSRAHSVSSTSRRSWGKSEGRSEERKRNGTVKQGRTWSRRRRTMYRPNFYESTCLRCSQTVYQVDRVGPLKDFTFFHAGCFKCAICGTKLTLKTYYNNQHTINDKEVYCSSHVPKPGPGTLDGSSVGIRSALNVPRSGYVNEQIRAGGASPRGVYPPW